MMWDWHVDGWSWMWMGLMMVVFWGLVVAGIVWVVRAFSAGPSTGGAGRRTPEDILAERYARGEIESDEYRRRLDELHARSQR